MAPVPRPGKVIAIGRNYPAHLAEEDASAPSAPLIFSKWSSCVIGSGDEIRWDPELTSKVDYEAELGVVIGRRARRVRESQALEYVLGYTCINDVSARDLQFGDGQWTRGKSLDTFCPIGPALVTTDEISNPDDLAVTCHRQRGTAPVGPHVGDVLRGGPHRQPLLAGLHPGARGRHRHGHAGRRRRLPQAARSTSTTGTWSRSRWRASATW